METSIGVFSTLESAEECVRELWSHGVPEESIVYLTCSEHDAKIVGRELGGSGGMTVGAWSLPDLGAVFALGFGAAALLGLPVVNIESRAAPTARGVQNDEFFREVLKAGRSVIVVRTESDHIAKEACAILDRLGMGMQGKTPGPMQVNTRRIGEAAVLRLSGRITFGEGNVMLRDVIRDLTGKGIKRIVLDLDGVNYLDSSGVGELVRTHTTICNTGGELRLTRLSKRVRDLLEATKLVLVFDIREDEASAIRSFGDHTSARAIA